MKALVIGATGATGIDLVNELLQENTFTEIHIFVRKPFILQHAKLFVHVIDFDEPRTWQHLVTGDVAFSCMGTTLKNAGSKHAQWKVDYTYQYNFAKAANENDVAHFILVSAYGANKKSLLFYPRMKGLLEEAIQQLTFSKLTFFNPGLLVRQNTNRFGEKVMFLVLNLLNRLGTLKSQQPLPTNILAKAMLKASKTQQNPLMQYSLQQIALLV